MKVITLRCELVLVSFFVSILLTYFNGHLLSTIVLRLKETNRTCLFQSPYPGGFRNGGFSRNLPAHVNELKLRYCALFSFCFVLFGSSTSTDLLAEVDFEQQVTGQSLTHTHSLACAQVCFRHELMAILLNEPHFDG